MVKGCLSSWGGVSSRRVFFWELKQHALGGGGFQFSETIRCSEGTSFHGRKARTPHWSRVGSETGSLTSQACVTLNPSRVTLNPSRVTLNPSRVTLNPSCVTLNLSRVTLNPSRVTLNPSRVTLNPSRVTLNPSRVTLNPSRVTLNPSRVARWTSSK